MKRWTGERLCYGIVDYFMGDKGDKTKNFGDTHEIR